VKLSSLALDYDGTISRDDRLDPAVREAIAVARRRGITVLLVTGRILDDLRRVAGELHFVDAVVAENGAVLHFPESEHTTQLAPAIPGKFVDELARRNVAVHAGQSLVDTDAANATVLPDVIRTLELPLVLIFNKGRVMAMPQGVSKGTGLHAALDTLRLSPRNTLAVGDAENDHEMLRLAEVGVAVPWGSAALQAAADLTLSGDGTSAVAAYLRELTDSGHLPAAVQGRRRLLLGHTEDGREFLLAARGRNVLIAGDSRSGKSWIAGLLSEQLILHGYCVCVIDPEGDYRSLEALPGVTVLGGEDPPPTPRDLIRALRYPDRSVVIDLSRVTQDAKLSYIRSALATLNRLRAQTGLPHRIVIDEAHYFLHDGDFSLLDLERNGYTVITYCASRLPTKLLDSTEVIIVTCESNPAEIDALFKRCKSCRETHREDWNALARLRPGQAIALPITTESQGRLQLFTVARRLTPHVRHRQKYVDVPVSDPRAFVFTMSPMVRARTLRQFVDELERGTAHALAPFVDRGDFSRWIRDVFGDHALAAELRVIESRHRGKADGDTIADLIDAIRARYDLRDDVLAGGAERHAAGGS
jgi:hydroxymethylpyrimidine pyrophosphatase-like HAD family hydrolase